MYEVQEAFKQYDQPRGNFNRDDAASYSFTRFDLRDCNLAVVCHLCHWWLVHQCRARGRACFIRSAARSIRHGWILFVREFNTGG